MLIKPFGPLILQEVISEDFLNFLVDASVQTKTKNENVGWDLAGNIDDQLQSVIDPKRFMKEIYPFIFIDQTQRGQISNYRLYTKIIGKIR